MTNRIIRAFGQDVPEWAQGERFGEWAEQVESTNARLQLIGVPIKWAGKLHIRDAHGIWVEVKTNRLGD